MAKKSKTGSKQTKRSVKKGTRKKKVQNIVTTKSILIALGIIAALTFIALSPVLQADFVDIDDKKLLLDRGQIFLDEPGRLIEFRNPSPHYKPVTYAVWSIEYKAVGPKPFLYHFNNLLLHILNCVLIFFLTRKISRQFERTRNHEFYIAFFTALFFGIHPLHVESVAWVVERKDVLYTAFYLLSLTAYVRYLEHDKKLYLGISVLTYLLSAFSKAPGITVIAIIFLLDFVWKRKLTSKLFIEKAGHFVALGIAMYGLGFFAGAGEGSLAALTNDKILARSENVKNLPNFYGKVVLGSMRAWLWYFHSLLPFKTSIGYPREAIIGFWGPLVHIFPVMLAALGGFLLYNAKRYRLLFFAHAFFFITLSPAIVRLGLGIGIFMSDRYIYLSVFGLIFLLISWFLTINDSRLQPKAKYGVLAVVALLFTGLTFSGARVWQNTETLWTNVIDKYPAVPYSYVNRGSYYREQGIYDKALADLNKGIELDDNLNARIQRGLIYRQNGNAQQAIVDYTEALELEPDDSQALINRGNAYLDTRQYRLAIADFDAALAQKSNVRGAVNRAIAYASLGDYASAQQSFASVEEAARAQNNSDFFLNRAIMWVEMRQYANAIGDYGSYLALNPTDHQIHNDKGIVHNLLGQPDLAVQSLSTAISIYPDKSYYLQRARAYDALGNAAAAQADRAAGQ